MVWNTVHAHANSVVISAHYHLKQWREAQLWSSKALFSYNSEGDGAETWVKPQNDVIKVTADAATFEQGAYGFGLIAGDNSGFLVRAKSGSKQGKVSSDYAEVVAIKC